MGGFLASLGAEAIVGTVTAIIQRNKINQWTTLALEQVFVCVVSFQYVCGTILGTSGAALAALHHPIAGAIMGAVGAGQVASAKFMTRTWRKSPLAKGTTISLPAEEAIDEMHTNVQDITK